MEKNITVVEGHTSGIKVDHRNGNEKEVENRFEVRPVIDGYHNATLRDKYKYGRDFVTMFSEDLLNLVMRGDLKLNEWKVLIYLIATLDKENVTFTNLDEIAINLGMHRNNVSKYLNSLIRRHLIIETKVQRRSRTGAQTLLFQVPLAQLNYNLCFNSQTKDYKKVRWDHPQITLADGQTILNPLAETERLKLLQQKEETEAIVASLSPDPESFDPETGEIFDNQERDERFVGNLQTGEFDIR